MERLGSFCGVAVIVEIGADGGQKIGVVQPIVLLDLIIEMVMGSTELIAVSGVELMKQQFLGEKHPLLYLHLQTDLQSLHRSAVMGGGLQDVRKLLTNTGT